MAFGYPHQKGMMLAIPWSGRPLPPQIAECLWQLQPPMNYNVRHLRTTFKPIAEARNFFAEQAIANDCRYLFMMDEDVAVPPYAIRQLVHRLEHFEKAGIAAGIYCQKSHNPAPMVFRANGDGPFWKWKAGELFECESIGMGCSLIRVSMLKDLEKPWFKTVDDNDSELDNIHLMTGFTEDIWFCQQVRKAGWTILADGALLPDHLDLQTGKPTNLPPDSYPVQHLLPQGKKKIVDLGSGGNPYQTNEGKVITCDIREEAKPDYRCDLRRLPFATGEFDVVFSSHTLEHFPRAETNAVLDEWVRILKPDGELRLVLPNVKWAAEKLMKDEVDDNVLNVLYGQQSYGENFHQMGFTPETVRKLLVDRKFKSIDLKTEGYNIIAIATRVDMTKKKGKKK